jgi:hypothetical protein
MALPILDFLVAKMQEQDPTYEYRPGTAFTEMFMQPLALMLQPFRDEANLIGIGQSLKRILDLAYPDDFPEDIVDDLCGNFFTYRRQGGLSQGVGRAYFLLAIDITVLESAITFTSVGGQTFHNIIAINMTASEMNNQIENGFYYVDVPIVADAEGSEYDIDVDTLMSCSDSRVASLTNKAKFSGGLPKETNTEFIARTQKSIGVRDLNTGKGFNAIMFETFPSQLVEAKALGFGDPEMMRDIQFNYHIGGRIDGFVKTPSVLEGTFIAQGMDLDFSRRTSTSTNLILEGTTSETLGRQSIDVTDNDVRVFNIEDPEKSASFISMVDLVDPLDLSANQFIRIGIDGKDPANIKISGAHPATTRSGEIVNRINVALGMSVASIVVNPTIVSRRNSGNVAQNSSVYFVDPTEKVFANVAVGDMLSVTTGPNKGVYIVQSIINNNELMLSSSLPFAQVETNYRVNRTGSFLRIISPTASQNSQVLVGSPTAGSDALQVAMGLPSGTYIFSGKGRYEYVSALHYSVNLTEGTIQRLIGATILPNTFTGVLNGSLYFEDTTPDIFLNVEPGDIISIVASTHSDIIRDFRVREKVNNNRLRLDTFLPYTESGITYRISRTGIKDAELVFITFDFNPLSIDIGGKVVLDAYGRVRGIRPNRANYTIADTAFLYIKQLELVDPISLEPLGVILEGKGGYGRGGYGRGGYGVGSQAQYSMRVNIPEVRFSAFEDSYISIDSAYLGQSLRVTYAYVPEVNTFHDFTQSDSQRVIDADVLIKHYIPAVVDIDCTYTTDPTNAATPTVDVVRQALIDFINFIPAGQSLDASDISGVITDQIDPSKTRRIKIKTPIKMTASIHNTDGSQTIIYSDDTLAIPSDTIPPYTPAPLSPRISHWIAGNINLTVLTVSSTGAV